MPPRKALHRGKLTSRYTGDHSEFAEGKPRDKNTIRLKAVVVLILLRYHLHLKDIVSAWYLRVEIAVIRKELHGI